MEWNTADLNSWPAKLVTKVGHRIRSVRSSKFYSNEAIAQQREKDIIKRNQRKNGQPVRPSTDAASQADVNEMGEREYSIFSESSTLVEQPPTDHTDMMHRLAHYDSFDSLVDNTYVMKKHRIQAADPKAIAALAISDEDERRIAALPDELWKRIASYLSAADAACLALSTKTFARKLGPSPVDILREPKHKHQRIRFLHRLDRDLPDHLLCFPCAKFHLRAQRGAEKLKADIVHNPLFACPNVRRTILPRTRLVYHREFPYAFVQLAVRAHLHGPAYGLSADALSRRWKCRDSGWTHQTRYQVHDGRLLMRVISSTIAPPGARLTETSARHLLYEREDYVPYFSVCAHWRDGELMRVCKCALSHVPSPPDPYHRQLQRGFKVSRSAARPNFLVRGCDDCRPARRCPECPTEYLVEVQMVEDAADAATPFKHALVVTRWSDLGDGSSPATSPEWAAIHGLSLPSEEDDDPRQAYESFTHVGRRAVGGIFESRISGTIPGQRLISLNPKNEKLGEEGHGWY